jgi:hypothetical protein
MTRKFRVAAAVGVFAICSGLGFAVAQQVLHPELTPEKGSFDKPEGKLGAKADQPWSTTTMAASIDGKPVPGKVVSVVGEIIDLSCYLQVGKHGAKHRDCGQKCLRNGQPIGLLTKDGNVFLLMEEEHDPRRDGLTNFRQAAIDNMAYVMEITGTQSKVGNLEAIFVHGYVKAPGGVEKK